MSLSIQEDSVKFHSPFDRSIKQNITLKNRAESAAVAFRATTTANGQYFVSPNTGVIAAGDTLNVSVIRLPDYSGTTNDPVFLEFQSIHIPENIISSAPPLVNSKKPFWITSKYRKFIQNVKIARLWKTAKLCSDTTTLGGDTTTTTAAIRKITIPCELILPPTPPSQLDLSGFIPPLQHTRFVLSTATTRNSLFALSKDLGGDQYPGLNTDLMGQKLTKQTAEVEALIAEIKVFTAAEAETAGDAGLGQAIVKFTLLLKIQRVSNEAVATMDEFSKAIGNRGEK
ncbi:hypothetical protein BDR26DRAFT_1005069 [Obelidium mucronatum]|nr:hypothetical protein BDR26DRAFT_1005069 [Obelidium mucronatum]